jgi:hypothetical protein
MLMTVDMRDAVLTPPVFGTLGGQRSEPTDPGKLALDADCSIGRTAYGASRLPIVTAMPPLPTR